MRAERGEDARAHEQDEEGIAHGLDLLGASHGSQEHHARDSHELEHLESSRIRAALHTGLTQVCVCVCVCVCVYTYTHTHTHTHMMRETLHMGLPGSCTYVHKYIRI